jgi:tRNA (cmo5U34)-methyltransferase
MGQFHFDPDTYLELMAEEVPGYARLQAEVAAATGGIGARRILELGTGTGETATRVLALHPGAHLVGIDVSESMLTQARRALPDAELHVARLEDPLPAGPFDLVVSALTIHHLDGAAKADLFRRVADVLRPGARLVIGDVVVPDVPADAVTPITDDYDKPSPVEEHLRWLAEAGLQARLVWQERDLAVLAAEQTSAD